MKKLCVVTGASSGIGYELAKVFGSKGYDLAIVAEDNGIFSARDSLGQTGANVEAYQIDLATFAGVEEFFGRISRGPIDVICLNAGVGVGGDFATQTTLESELNMINLNVVSTVHLAKRVVQKMLTDGTEGKILFTSSMVAAMPNPFLAVYAATKAFVQSFGQAIRNELSDSKISVTCLMPGATETNFFERADMEKNTPVGQAKKDDPAQVAEQAFEALMAGKDHIVAGNFMNSVMTGASALMPEAVATKFARKQSEPKNLPKH